MSEIASAPPLRSFVEYENEMFTARRNDGETVDLRLEDIDTSRNGRDDWERFSLRFETVDEGHLEQGTYRFSHPNMDAFDMSITPTRTSDPDPESCIYEAVFDRHVPNREESDSLVDRMSASRRNVVAGVLGTILGGGVLNRLLGDDDTSWRAQAATSDSFIGHIMLFAGNFTVNGFAECNGQELPINQYQSLFSLLGTTYGGDGRTTFRLPDLRGRVPVHVDSGDGFAMGDTGGSESVTLSTDQLPAHDHGPGDVHVPVSSQAGTATDPSSNALAAQPDARGTVPVYTDGSTDGEMPTAGSVAETGGGNAHDNMPPYQVVSYQIALTGTYPSRS